MLIVNADDWGRSVTETDLALTCFKEGRITSVTAMLFMEDSERAAGLALEAGVEVGLHLNLSQPFTAAGDRRLLDHHARIVRFLTFARYCSLIYNPLLRSAFRYVYQAQVAEFHRLYGRAPSHIDGHQHMHLCMNMLLDKVIPAGEKLRRNFTFRPGEKGTVNRGYRALVDRFLAKSYTLTDFFFTLSQCFDPEGRRTLLPPPGASVEIMVHPLRPAEFDCLMKSRSYRELLEGEETGTYGSLGRMVK